MLWALQLRKMGGPLSLGLSAKARPKSAFVTPTDKYEFTRYPFRLMQAPAYFQRLINKVLVGLDFTFG